MDISTLPLQHLVYGYHKTDSSTLLFTTFNLWTSENGQFFHSPLLDIKSGECILIEERSEVQYGKPKWVQSLLQLLIIVRLCPDQEDWPWWWTWDQWGGSCLCQGMSFPCIMQIPCMGVGHNKKPFHSCPKERVYGQLDRHIYDGVLCLASVVLCCLSNRKNVGSELPWCGSIIMP